MAKALVAVGVALVVCIGALALLVFLTRDEDRVAVDNLLAEQITRAIALAEGRGRPVRLGELTSFDWDRVLIVQAGTPREAISAALGSEFRGDLNYDVESRGLFVFADGRALARFADYRGQGRLAGFEAPIAERARENAALAVRDLEIRPG